MENKGEDLRVRRRQNGNRHCASVCGDRFPVKLLAFDVREQQTSAGVIEDNPEAVGGKRPGGCRCDEIRKRIDIVLDFDEGPP